MYLRHGFLLYLVLTQCPLAIASDTGLDPDFYGTEQERNTEITSCVVDVGETLTYLSLIIETLIYAIYACDERRIGGSCAVFFPGIAGALSNIGALLAAIAHDCPEAPNFRAKCAVDIISVITGSTMLVSDIAGIVKVCPLAKRTTTTTTIPLIAYAWVSMVIPAVGATQAAFLEYIGRRGMRVAVVHVLTEIMPSVPGVGPIVPVDASAQILTTQLPLEFPTQVIPGQSVLLFYFDINIGERQVHELYQQTSQNGARRLATVQVEKDMAIRSKAVAQWVMEHLNNNARDPFDNTACVTPRNPYGLNPPPHEFVGGGMMCATITDTRWGNYVPATNWCMLNNHDETYGNCVLPQGNRQYKLLDVIGRYLNEAAHAFATLENLPDLAIPHSSQEYYYPWKAPGDQLVRIYHSDLISSFYYGVNGAGLGYTTGSPPLPNSLQYGRLFVRFEVQSCKYPVDPATGMTAAIMKTTYNSQQKFNCRRRLSDEVDDEPEMMHYGPMTDMEKKVFELHSKVVPEDTVRELMEPQTVSEYDELKNNLSRRLDDMWPDKQWKYVDGVTPRTLSLASGLVIAQCATLPLQLIFSIMRVGILISNSVTSCDEHPTDGATAFSCAGDIVGIISAVSNVGAFAAAIGAACVPDAAASCAATVLATSGSITGITSAALQLSQHCQGLDAYGAANPIGGLQFMGDLIKFQTTSSTTLPPQYLARRLDSVDEALPFMHGLLDDLKKRTGSSVVV